MSSDPELQHGHPDEGPLLERPSSIRTAVRLMYAGAVLAVVNLALAFLATGSLRTETASSLQSNGSRLTAAQVDAAVSDALLLATSVGLLGVLLWLLVARTIWRGHAWARVVATVLGVVNVVTTGLAVATGSGAAATLLVPAVSAILAVAIVVLLWRPESSHWFARL